MSIGATIVVQFGEGADSSAFVAVELDETLNRDSEGNVKSQFNPGDQPWWWIQHDPVLRIDRVTCTSGMVVAAGEVARSRKQELTWITADEGQDLSHIPASNPALTWYGNVGQGLSRDGRKLTLTGGLPCTADAIIPIQVHLYRYVPPPLSLSGDATWRSIIVVHLEAA